MFCGTVLLISFHAWSLKLMVEGDICSNKYVNNYD